MPLKLQELKERFGPGGDRVSHLDGISFEFADWHFNVRPVEHRAAAAPQPGGARPQEAMERRRDEVLAVIRS